MKVKILPFNALGYRFVDSQDLSREERHHTIGLLLDGLQRVSPEIRCQGNILELTGTSRTQKTELTEEECNGDILPISFAAFDPKATRRRVIGAFNLYGIRIVSETRDLLTVRARPLPAFNDLDGQEYANFALDMMKFFVDTDLELDDRRKLSFDAIEFSTFFKPDGDQERETEDIRVQLVDEEFERRRIRTDDPIDGTKTIDPEGRRINAIRKPPVIVKRVR